MTTACTHIGALVLRIENVFLDTPGLALTPAQARRRFGPDGQTCDAVLEALTDACVLARTIDGSYIQFRPARAQGFSAAA